MDEMKWYDKYIQPPSNKDVMEIYKGLSPVYQDIMILKQIVKEF